MRQVVAIGVIAAMGLVVRPEPGNAQMLPAAQQCADLETTTNLAASLHNCIPAIIDSLELLRNEAENANTALETTRRQQAAIDRAFEIANTSRDIVICKIDDLRGRPSSRDSLQGFVFDFNPSDCTRDRLPDERFIGMANTILICGGQDNFRILKRSIVLYGTPFCNDHPSAVEVVYIRR